MNCLPIVRLSVPCLLLLCGVVLSIRAEDAKPLMDQAEAYPLGSLMKVLEQDLTRNVVWKTELPGPGNGSPTIWDDRLFVVADVGEEHERQLLCYSRSNGKLIWKQAAPKAEQKEKLYWKNTYFSSTPVTDKVLAENELDADTLTTPALLDGRLYFRTKTDLICIGSNPKP
jgi:outer membrane protein assembly factor BamB